MASCNLSYDGSTGVLQASASVSEVTRTGTQRKVRLSVFVKPIDYSGARTFGFSVNLNGDESYTNGSSIDGGGYTIYNDEFYVNLPYGSTSASIDFSFRATVVSPSSGNKTISGTITSISGLTVEQGDTTLSGAGNTQFGSACSVTWKSPSSSMYHKLRFSLGSWSDMTAPIHPGTTSTYTYTGYTIPLGVASQIPNAESATMTVTLYTYSNSNCTAQVGSASSVNFTVTVPANVKPWISSRSASIDNSENAVVNGWGIAVAGFTRLKVVASASGSYGSTISRFIIEGAYTETISAPSLSYVGAIIQSSGQKVLTITCVDSRGRRSDSVTTTPITFSSYFAPYVSQLTAEREKNNGAATGRVILKAIFGYDVVGGKNGGSAILYYRVSGNTSWSGGWAVTNNTAYIPNVTMDDAHSYTFKVVLTDSVGNAAEKTVFVSTASVLLDFKQGGDGLGVGKICENPGMEVNMDTTFYKGVKIGELTLEQFMQNIMRFLPSNMYGWSLPAYGQEGQIFFKKM